MNDGFKSFFLQNGLQKAVALASAIIIWLVVNHSITITRTLPNVPIRVIQIPQDKTVQGLLPNGYLNTRLSLTLSGSKAALEELDSSDLEIVVDVSQVEDIWLGEVSKKMLRSLNPELDIRHHVSDVSPVEFWIRMSPLGTAKIPVEVAPPLGDPPKGYQFVDIWPQKMIMSLSGPEEDLKELKRKGLKLNFNLSQIPFEELEALQEENEDSPADEISFSVPESWKKVAIPFMGDAMVPINDPAAQNLRINFLRREFLPIQKSLPLEVFYPSEYRDQLNPLTYPLAEGSLVQMVHGIPTLNMPLFTRGVSRTFLDTTRDNLEITVIAAPTSVQDQLEWTVQFINLPELERAYVEKSMASLTEKDRLSSAKIQEEYFQNRFRNYSRQFGLFKSNGQPLTLDIQLGVGEITVNEPPELESKPESPSGH